MRSTKYINFKIFLFMDYNEFILKFLKSNILFKISITKIKAFF